MPEDVLDTILGRAIANICAREQLPKGSLVTTAVRRSNSTAIVGFYVLQSFELDDVLFTVKIDLVPEVPIVEIVKFNVTQNFTLDVVVVV